jgi:siroheme synthase-like protein
MFLVGHGDLLQSCWLAILQSGAAIGHAEAARISESPAFDTACRPQSPAVAGLRYYIKIAENRMGYIPLFMAVTSQPCAVVGGGPKAEERVRMLLEAEADVTVISPSLTSGLNELVKRGTIKHRARALASGDLVGFVMVYCSDPDPSVAQRATAEARTLGLPINVTDRPELCSFIAPAVIKRGPLQIAVSTSGASPALARIIRQELEARIGPEYKTLLTVLAASRSYLQRREPDAERRTELAQVLAHALREALMRGDYRAADIELRRHLGLGLADFGIRPSGSQSALEDLPGKSGSR